MQHKIAVIFVFAFALLFLPCKADDDDVITTDLPELTTSESPLPTTSSSSLEIEKEVKKIGDFADGLEVLLQYHLNFESYNGSSEPIVRNFKKVMEASRKCGIILSEGSKFGELKEHFKKENKTNPVISRIELLSLYRLTNLCVKTTYDYRAVQSTVYNYYLEKIMQGFENNCFAFRQILPTLDNEHINKFKETCENDFFKSLNNEANYTHFEALKSAEYSDEFYLNFYSVYRNVLNHGVSTFSMCSILKNGIPSLETSIENGKTVLETVQKVGKVLRELKREREEKYWSIENILKIVKFNIFGQFPERNDFRYNNQKIARDIYDALISKYKLLGYTFHVGVSQTGTQGNVDTLIQCSTDCRYIYNINNKDVYIIRNKRTPSYKECEIVATKKDMDQYGNKHIVDPDSTALTEYANKIQSKCNPAAFSLVRERLNYGYKGDESEHVYVNDTSVDIPSGFYQKNLGDIYLVMAKNY